MSPAPRTYPPPATTGHDCNGGGDRCAETHVRHFGAMDINFERRDDVAVSVQVHVSTLLVAVTLLAPEDPEWSFDVEAGGAAARGELRVDLGALGSYSTITGSLEYTASGTLNRYRGLLWHWEASGRAPARPTRGKRSSERSETGPLHEAG